ncbi:MATE family efflux transporter [Natronospora cellulosivora (SeqCode)]
MREVKKLHHLAIPIFFETLLFMVLRQADIIMLSQFDDRAAGAVGASFQLFGTMNIIFAIISAGTAVLVAQYVGAQNKVEIERVSSVSLAVNLIIGIILSLVIFIFADSILIALGVTDDLLLYASDYMKIAGGALFIQAVLNTLMAIIRSHGYTKESMKISVSMNILNVIGNAIFIFGLFGVPVLGVKGVAIATVGGKVFATIVAFIFLFKYVLPIDMFTHIMDKPILYFKKLFSFGFPAAMENMSYSLYQAAIMYVILNYLGDMAYITRTYVWTITWFVMVFAIAIGQANQIMIGQLIGSGKVDEAYDVGLKNFKIAMLLSVFASIALFLSARYLMRIYTSDQDIILLGASTLAVAAFSEPGRTFNIVFISGLRGAGDVYFPVVMAIFSMWGVGLVGAYVFGVVLGYGLPGIWMGLLIDEWFRGVCMLQRWRSRKWTGKAVVDKEVVEAV